MYTVREFAAHVSGPEAAYLPDLAGLVEQARRQLPTRSVRPGAGLARARPAGALPSTNIVVTVR